MSWQTRTNSSPGDVRKDNRDVAMFNTDDNTQHGGIQLIDYRRNRAEAEDSNHITKANYVAGETTTAEAKEKIERDQIKEVWSQFQMDTTCHGIKTLGSPTYPKPVRVLFSIFMVLMLVSLYLTASNLYFQYMSKKTVTRTEIFVASNMMFPSVILCNLCPFSFRGKNESDPLYQLMAKTSRYHSFMPEMNYSEPSFVKFLKRSAKDVFNEYSTTLDIYFAEYDGTTLNISHFEPIDSPNGRCHQFNGPRYAAAHGQWKATKFGRNSGFRAIINIKQDEYGVVGKGTAGIEMFISNPHETPLTDGNGIQIMPGTSSLVSLKTRKIQFLPEPYRSYGSEYCENFEDDSPELLAKMKSSSFYSYTLCRDQCIAYMASYTCSCHIESLGIPGLKPCTAYDYIFGCYRDALTNISKSVDTHCDCPKPCSITTYDTVMSASQFPSKVALQTLMKAMKQTNSAIIKENYLEVQVYFEASLVTQQIHEPKMSFESFFSMLGGQMGLSLGASLITVCEILELIRHTLAICIRWFINRLQGNRLQQT